MSKIDEISIVFPCEKDRMPLLLNTLMKYQGFGIPPKVELVIVSRTIEEMVIPGWDIKIVQYQYEGEHFCPSLAFNLGVGVAKYKNIIIGHPEVKPISNVLNQFFDLPRGNYVCRVYDSDETGRYTSILFGTGYREEWIGLYFLALYRKEDIEAINGWDMRFMEGYSNEDIDFGQRLTNAGISCKIMDDITAVHQYHPRGICSDENAGWLINRKIYRSNRDDKVTSVENGLKEVLNEQ